MGVAKYNKNEKDEVLDVILQSGIHIKPFYTQKDLEEVGFDPKRIWQLQGISVYTRNPPRRLPQQRVDDSAIHGLRNAQRDQ